MSDPFHDLDSAIRDARTRAKRRGLNPDTFTHSREIVNDPGVKSELLALVWWRVGCAKRRGRK